MDRTVLIRGARQLLTLNGPPGVRRGSFLRNLSIIEDGSVLISGGTIASVGSTRRIENLADARIAEEIDASGKVVMPAFVDSHFDLMRDCAVASATSRSLGAQADRMLRWCVRHGTTTLEGRSGCGIDESTDLRMLRSASRLETDLATVVPVYAGPQSAAGPETLEWLENSLFPRIRSKRLARFAWVRCGEDGLSPEDTRRYAEMCRRHELGLKIDTGELEGATGVQVALECGASAITGLLSASDSDAAALARSETVATLVPAAAFTGAVDRYPPARRLIDNGVAVALASGFRHREVSTFTMQAVITLACANMGMTVAEAIAAATVNGAYALGLGGAVGSLQYGKAADILILDVADYRELFTHFGGNLVAVTIKNGRAVYRETEPR